MSGAVPPPASETASPAPDRRHEAHRTLRNAAMVAGSRVFHVAAAAVFAVLVPRVMGPTVFGRFSLLTSVMAWFAQVSGMGVFSVLTRHVPSYLAAGDRAAAEKLFTNVLALRAGSTVFSAVVYFLIVGFALGEPDLVAAGFIAAAIPLRMLTNLTLTFHLGRNEAARWTVGELLLRWLTLAGVTTGTLTAGLRGACAGLFASALIVFVAVLTGARSSIRWPSLDLTSGYLRPFLRTGGPFAVAHLLHQLAARSGSVIVRLATGSYAQVGYYGAAYAIYNTGAQAIATLSMSLTPFLIARLHHGERRTVAGWLERLLALLVLGTVLIALSAVFLGPDVVPWVLGREFAPVAASLVPIAAALVPIAFGTVGRVVALAADRPMAAAVSALCELVVSWVAGWLLARAYGAPGAAAGVMLAAVAWAWTMAWRTRGAVPYSFRPALKALALGAAFLPAAWLRGAWPVNVGLWAASAGLYLLLAVRLGIVSLEDVARVRQLARRRDRTASVALDENA